MSKFIVFLKEKFQKEYFVILLPVFFVFHELNEYIGIVAYTDALELVLRYLLLTSLVLSIFFLLFRAFRKAAVFSFILMSGYFFFGSFHRWLKQTLGDTFIAKYSFLLPIIFLLLVFLFVSLYRSKARLNTLAKYLNTLLVVLLLVEITKFMMAEPEVKDIIQQAADSKTLRKQGLQSCDTCNKEDIYLIVVDGYAGETELSEVLLFDNSVFSDALTNRGFHVVESSRSNYNYSEVSVASMFSLGLLQNLDDKSGNELSYIGRAVVNKSIFVDYLKMQGYQIENYSIFDLDEQKPSFRKGHFDNWKQLITDQTFFSKIQADLGFHLFSTVKLKSEVKRIRQQLKNQAYEDIYKIDEIRKRASVDGSSPRFFYVHLLMPHDPYYFNKEGQLMEDLNYISSGAPDERKAYLEYLQFTNKKILYLIDGILRNSRKPPVILLMSDHGFRHSSIEARYHFMTLNAVYFPDKRYEGFYPGMSNVNQLRILLNNRFHQQLSLLSDSSTYFEWSGR